LSLIGGDAGETLQQSLQFVFLQRLLEFLRVIRTEGLQRGEVLRIEGTTSEQPLTQHEERSRTAKLPLG